MNFSPFTLTRLPRIEFGAGRLAKLPALAKHYGTRALLVTGAQSFCGTAHWPLLLDTLRLEGLSWEHVKVAGEPSPQFVDQIVSEYRHADIAVVIGIGGGSVLDAAKAIAGLLPHGNSVMDHLEGVGPELPYRGPAMPFIAVPTTAGTGSEATKNAVLSVQGPQGFKKSFRDEALVPEWAIVDPTLLASCPPDLIAANGMDALTQLIESFVSLKANPFTDALALSGIESVKRGLLPWYQGEADTAEPRAAMAYAALLSGITLAQVGLGSVHGLAAPLGAFHPIPHGTACGTLLAAATAMNIETLRQREPDHVALAKYAQLGSLLTGKQYKNRENAWEALLKLLRRWTTQLKLPTLGRYGVTAGNMDLIVANARGSSMKTNPIVLTDEEIGQILSERL
jgi:alcohol dehydrogenase class IV